MPAKTSKAKRGQLAGNVFIYLFSIVVIGIILIVGYQYILSTKENINKADLALFKNKLSSDIKAIGSDYGSSKKVSYSIPSSAELCFLDLGKKSEILGNLPENFNPLIKDSIQSNIQKNAFVLSSSIFEPFQVGEIELNEPYFKCLKPIAGKVSFVIEGAGNRTLILFEN